MKNAELLANLFSEETITIRDALWKDIRLSPGMKRIIRSGIVQKLGRIRQLGPVSLVYPSAVHTRLGHSLGVYHLSNEIIISLLSREDSNLFTEEGIHAFLAAALLHDIGHFPYAHSLKELSLKTHEELAAELITQEGELKDAIVSSGADPSVVADIIDTGRTSENAETAFYRALLSGALDPDKLDYLNRDAFFCGVPYGFQDVPFIIRSLCVREEKPTLSEAAISSVEHVLFAKYLMYRTVYWHKDVRAATAMIKEALLSALRDGDLQEGDLYGLDDNSFFRLAQTIRNPAFALLCYVGEGKLLTVKEEHPFDENNPFDLNASSMEGRMRAEDDLFRVLSPRYPALRRWEVVIDIPEPVSFDATMPILRNDDSLSDFATEDRLFSSDVGRTFSSCLRFTRVYLPSYVDDNKWQNLLH